MPKGKTTLSGIATAAIFIALEVAAALLLRSSAPLQNIWINRFSHSVMAVTWNGVLTVRDFFSLRRENDALARRNFALMEELGQFRARESAATADERLKGSGLSGQFRYTPAEISAMGTNSRHNYIILNKGLADGVHEGSAVITTCGVVGVITAADERYSYGLSLMNERVTVSARIGREGLVAPLEWDGGKSDHAILRNIPLHLSVEPGDTVFTGNTSLLYPPDIPLGVTEGTRLRDGAESVVDVELFEDLARVRYVIVAENTDRNIVERLAQ